MFGQSTDNGPRTFDLLDGRVLYYAAGRAYYLNDRAHAQRLDARLTWIHSLSTLAIAGTILAAHWTRNWWVGCGAILGFLLAAFAEHFVVYGCTEATDPAARAEVIRRSAAREVGVGSALFWPALIALVTIALLLLRGRTAKAPFQVVEIVLLMLAVALGGVQLLRQRHARQQREIIGEPRSAENVPIVPR